MITIEDARNENQYAAILHQAGAELSTEKFHQTSDE